MLELPATGWLRRYRVRAHRPRHAGARSTGCATASPSTACATGRSRPRSTASKAANVWLTFAIREGKNREVRKVLEQLGLKVNRLIRVSYGPFQLGELDDGAVEEIETAVLARAARRAALAAQAGADFEAPLSTTKRASRRIPVALKARARKPRSPAPPRMKPATHRSEHGASASSRTTRRNAPRRDRTGGPRPKYPRPK